MICDLCKQQLASAEPVSLLGTCAPVSQEKAIEYGKESFIWEPESYSLTLCMDCANFLDDLFHRLIELDLEVSCPFCSPEELCQAVMRKRLGES